MAYLGPPKIFHSDNGREFVNNLIRATFEKWGGFIKQGIKDLPYRVVFGRYPPVGIFPGAEKHYVDEEDLPITSTCDDPRSATLHTKPSTDTAAQHRQPSPSIRDDGNSAEGCVNLVSPGSCVAPQSVSGPKDEVDPDGEVEHSTLKLPPQVSETPDKQLAGGR